MTPGYVHEQAKRLVDLLAPFIEEGDSDLSDAEFVYRLKKRFDVHWNSKQTLVDPAE